MTPMNKSACLRLFEPISASLQIVRVNGQDVATNTALVRIKRMSPYSLTFTSDLKFPVSRQFHIRLSRSAEAGRLGVQGWISSSSHVGGRYIYTLELDEASSVLPEYHRLFSHLYRRQHLLIRKAIGLYATQELLTI